MQLCHQPTHTRARPAHPASGRGLAPSALSIPSLGSVPHQVLFQTEDKAINRFAELLIETEVLQPRHTGKTLAQSLLPTSDLNKPRATISGCCERALSDFCKEVRPNPLHEFKLYFSGNPEHCIYGFSPADYRRNYRLRHDPASFGIMSLHLPDTPNPTHRFLGPILRRMEEAHPRLGQTVLDVLDCGLWKSCRGCTPRSGYGWAQLAYWQGELDETMRLQEEMDDRMNWYEEQVKEPGNEKLKPPVDADIELFRKKDYDAAVPSWAGSGTIQPLSRKELLRLDQAKPRHLREFGNIISATAALSKRLVGHKREDSESDNNCFESITFEIVPFLLRWDANDPIANIWDDVLNEMFEGGDKEMDINAAFVFHDLGSFTGALKRMRSYIEITQLCENIIRHFPDANSRRVRVRA
jgi:PRTRC genetic system protein F